MSKLRREVGFWGSLGRLKISDLINVEYVSSLIIGGAVAVALTSLATREVRHAVAGDYLAITAALVGVVFAGMALVVALMSDSYLRLLDESPTGLPGFLGPFMIALGLQVGGVLSSVGYRAFGPLLPEVLEPWLFGFITVLFVASALEIIVLARSVFMHARLRAALQRSARLRVEHDRSQGSTNNE